MAHFAAMEEQYHEFARFKNKSTNISTNKSTNKHANTNNNEKHQHRHLDNTWTRLTGPFWTNQLGARTDMNAHTYTHAGRQSFILFSYHCYTTLISFVCTCYSIRLSGVGYTVKQVCILQGWTFVYELT